MIDEICSVCSENFAVSGIHNVTNLEHNCEFFRKPLRKPNPNIKADDGSFINFAWYLSNCKLMYLLNFSFITKLFSTGGFWNKHVGT